MKPLWKLLKYMPPHVRKALYATTTSRFRLWVRDHFGGSQRSIPDQVVTLADGRRIHIGPDYIYWPIYIGAEFEPGATSLVRRLVRPGDHVADVGANYGWYTTLFAQLVGATGHVAAFEPVPRTFERLSEHLRLNACGERVTAFCTAVGASPGEATIHVFDELSHSRSSLAKLDEGQCTTIAVPVVDLDSHLRGCGSMRIDFLKCDVEGSELNVLCGAHGILSCEDAPIVLVEINAETSAAFGYEPADLWHLLVGCGYDHFYRLDARGRVLRLREPSELRRTNLLLAGKGDRIAERLAESAGRAQKRA